jgi:hypothetical protein
MKDPVVWRVIRWLYGAYFVFLGVSAALQLIGVLPEPHWDVSPASAAFMTAMDRTGFLTRLLAFVFAASGLAFLVYRTAPLGVVLLAPVMVNIVLMDTLVDTHPIWATAHAAPLLALAWRFRSAYRPLWSYAPPAAGS